MYYSTRVHTLWSFVEHTFEYNNTHDNTNYRDLPPTLKPAVKHLWHSPQLSVTTGGGNGDIIHAGSIEIKNTHAADRQLNISLHTRTTHTHVASFTKI